MTELPKRLGPWRIDRMLARDLLGRYYAVRREGGERATLYVPAEPARGDDAAVTRLVELHRALFHAALIRFRGADRDGGELYLIADAADDALESLRSGCRPAPGQIRALGATVAAALGSAHDRGLAHGALELDNVLWAPGRDPQILGTGVAALHGDRGALIRGDAAALGRLLCALVIRQPLPDRRTLDAIEQLADPGAALSMRDAHALLAEGEPTRTAHPTGGSAPPGAAGRGDLPPGPDASATLNELAAGAPPGAPAPEAGGAAPEAGGPAPEAGGPAPEAGGAAPEAGGALARYRLLTLLGRGGMGEVFLAQDPVLRRAVAVKRIRPGLERERTSRARLRREAQVAARLNHRAIVQVFDLVSDGDADCVIMEYVAGPSLHALLGGRPMAVDEVLRIGAELADGLAYAHEHGVIHRDVKLENVLIGPDRQPKLTDFGIARRTAIGDDSTAQDALTGGRGIVGTLRAMSPEQVQGRELDARSDLFSFGVLLYELVTGTSPFAAGSDVETLLRVLHHHQLPALELVPGTPRALSELIDHLLDKTAARRPDSARSLCDRLRALRADAGPPGEARSERSPAAAAPPDPGSAAPVTIGAAGERRQVTLVCVELIAVRDGADELADPELIAGVLPAFRAGVDDIVAHGDGARISALGHRIITCFGHPRPLEDAARRAVLAGRAMLDAAAALRSRDPVHAGIGFAARAAVHTGLAIAGGRGGEDLLLGATLDAALRLVAQGRPGQLWLSDAAARLVEAEFQLEAWAPPGGAGPAWRLVGARIAPGDGSGEHDRPIVARDHEIQLLLDSWRHARHGQGQAALLIGEPGIGKSRLVRELAAAIAGDGPRHIVLRGHAHRQRSALEPVGDAMSALLGDAGGDSSAASARIRALTGDDEAAQVLQLMGRRAGDAAPAPERARHQLLCGLRDVLLGSARDAPTLLVIEDLHWLDPSTLDLIALIIQEAASWPVLVVMTARPGFQPPWPAGAAIVQLRLGRLEPPAIARVIAHACGDRALAADERAVIAARSEGVPLYAQELVRAALELGRAGEVPSTLRDALAARLHQLGPAATWVAHVAAVVGREFTAERIATAGGLDRAAVERELERLVAVEILLHRRGRGRDVLYRFGHALLQQAAYDELLAADRRHLHGQLADALLAEQRAGRDPGPELIAHHLAAARRFDEAVAAARRAAVLALGRHARVEARELLRQALSWLDQLPESGERDRTEIELRLALAAVLITTEGYTSPELERSCQRTEQLCERHDDMPLPVKYSLWAVRLLRGSPDEIAPLLRWLERELDRTRSPLERMMVHVSIGVHDYVRAAYDRAGHHFDRAMALFVPADHREVLQVYGGCGGFYAHVMTTMLLWHTGRFGQAWRHARDTVALAESLDPYSLGCALTFEMMLHIAVGDTERTEASAGRVHELATRYEFPFLVYWALSGRGWVAARRGQAGRAIADLTAGTGGIEQLGIKVWSPYCLGLLADGAIALGELDRAERALDDALEICRVGTDRHQEPELLRLRARLILGRDASARAAARAALSDAVAIAQRDGAVGLALRAATDLAALLRDDRRAGEAAAVLGAVYGGLASELDDPNLAAARRLLAELSQGAG